MSVIVLGAGGHAKVLIEALLKSGKRIVGIVDPDPTLAGAEILGVPVLGDDDIVNKFSNSEIQLVNGLGSIGIPSKRQHLYEKFKGMGYIFATTVHPSAVVASDVILGEGSQIMAGAVIQPGCVIGINGVINTRSSIDHDCTIGNHVHIAPGVTLSGGVSVASCSHIGTGATVIQGVAVGRGCLVAAGAVVTKDIADGVMVRGLPAREFV